MNPAIDARLGLILTDLRLPTVRISVIADDRFSLIADAVSA